MGMFDSFRKGDIEVQLKIGPCLLREYQIGDEIENSFGSPKIKDGVYEGSGGYGYVSIVDNIVTGISEKESDLHLQKYTSRGYKR
jgi:hypothetical protein